MPHSSNAFPELFDYARYTAQFGNKKYEIKKMIFEHDSLRDTFVMTESLYEDNILQDERFLRLPKYWFYTPEKINNVIKNCTRREGALGRENIQGQEIQTCTFFNEESMMDYSIGNVPFGQVRFQYRFDGVYLDFYLQNFKRGKSDN